MPFAPERPQVVVSILRSGTIFPEAFDWFSLVSETAGSCLNIIQQPQVGFTLSRKPKIGVTIVPVAAGGFHYCPGSRMWVSLLSRKLQVCVTIVPDAAGRFHYYPGKRRLVSLLSRKPQVGVSILKIKPMRINLKFIKNKDIKVF